MGSRRRIVATGRMLSGEEARDVALMWLEDDSTIAQVSAAGTVSGSWRSTQMTATDENVTAENSVNVSVIPGDADGNGGTGYPRVRAQRSTDPDTGEDVTLSSDIRRCISASTTWSQHLEDQQRRPARPSVFGRSFAPESREWRILSRRAIRRCHRSDRDVAGPEAEDTLEVGEWIARWGERAARSRSRRRRARTFMTYGDPPA